MKSGKNVGWLIDEYMIYKIADNVFSPLGETTEQNYKAVEQGCSTLETYVGRYNLPEPFCALFLSEEQNSLIRKDGLSHFEAMVLFSARKTLSHYKIDIGSPKVALIISTTKGNVNLLEEGTSSLEEVLPGTSAMKVARELGISTKPFVVCNACISGVSAIILASRLLEARLYDYALVCGADELNRFVVSGFQSLKALSPEPCKPFDMERTGLNLGEASASILFCRSGLDNVKTDGLWGVECGFVRNDAFHISTPSKNAEGAFLAIKETLGGLDTADLAFVNAHGTATMFNDQMESVALERASLSNVPVNAYKGCYGHTLGAAGVLETVLSMKAADNHVVLGTKGFEERGVSGNISLSSNHRVTEKTCFLKMISGFGGCNASVLFSKGHVCSSDGTCGMYQKRHEATITNQVVMVDGKDIHVDGKGSQRLTELYKRFVNDYPKYYKMDKLCRLGFVASELLLNAEAASRFVECDNRAVVLFNHSSSILSDMKYLETMGGEDDFYPSPSVFVYTLPNMVCGEIALRNHYHGETSFFILPEMDERQMDEVISASFLDKSIHTMITGWVDYWDDDNYMAKLELVERK